MDPQFLLFAQNAGYADAEAVAAGQYKVSSNLAALAGRQALSADAGKAEQKAIGDEAETRGVYSSGERIMAQNTASNSRALREGADTNQVSTENQGTYLEIARQLAETQRQIQQRGLSSVATTATNNAKGTLSPYL